jgi:hypothetical protein
MNEVGASDNRQPTAANWDPTIIPELTGFSPNLLGFRMGKAGNSGMSYLLPVANDDEKQQQQKVRQQHRL